MTDTQKYHRMHNALGDERMAELSKGHKHSADALSELCLKGMPFLVSLYNRITNPETVR